MKPHAHGKQIRATFFIKHEVKKRQLIKEDRIDAVLPPAGGKETPLSTQLLHYELNHFHCFASNRTFQEKLQPEVKTEGKG